MATQAIENVPASDAPVGGKGKNLVLLLALVGLVAGAGTGLFVVGPMLAPHHAAAEAAKPAETAPAVTYPIDNLVLNPVSKEGIHFLMVNATFEVKDAGVAQMFKDHEAEMRDRILTALGKRTIEELQDISQRDLIKADVQATVAALLPKGSVHRVLFPQFVVQ